MLLTRNGYHFSIIMLLMLQIKLASSTDNCNVQFDMVVAVDTSSSCTDAEFTKLLSEVKALVSAFPIGPAKTRLALISISQTAQVLANFNDVSSLSDFNSAVDRLRLTSERADISKGMKLARESVLNAARKAPTPKLLVLVKDMQCGRVTGSSDSELALMKSEAEAVRSSGGVVHAVGIGGLWNYQVLNALFGSDYLLFKNKNKALESIKSLNIRVCQPKCKHLGKFTKTGTCFGNGKHLMTVSVTSTKGPNGAPQCRQEIVRWFQWCREHESCSKIERSLGSCETDGKVSVSEMWQFFNRKTQSCTIHKEKQRVSCGEATECKTQVTDLVILLDRSQSLSQSYHTLVDATTELVKSLYIGPQHVRIGIISFSSDPLKEVVRLGVELDKNKILKEVEAQKKEYNFYQTNTGMALKAAKQMLDANGRPGVSKSVIIITDGKSDNPASTFEAASELKKSGITIFAIGVKPSPEYGSLDMNELNMLAAPESDSNLFIMDTFDQLKSWAIKFSMRLCIELAPPNPKLCEANVQLKSISACVTDEHTRLSTMQTTWIKYEYDSNRKCIKSFKNMIEMQCKDICIDPIDGSSHLAGDRWFNLCHEFQCNNGGRTQWPRKTKQCMAADLKCKPIGSAAFQCRNIDGELRDNCQCIGKNEEAVLVVIENPS